MNNNKYTDIPYIVTRQQLQDILCISKSTALHLLNSGAIESFRVKGRFRITRAAVLEFIQNSILYIPTKNESYHI